ncbi:uncharacterized protein I206_102594 [Kwoniella pini CBS 10737]|uniref:Translocation protein SEC66 n=1 Tax=Kwoniella pini CBS 10737 TaxID=1296096 RepID=A0A1B9I5U0_9TREE|nr:uncharacterized protein I206_02948 [Kwoniella pini CBS 10737]OCF50888.1 hypothetical protein I206_02948 [Kwoniella pini CBS 10737]
MATSLVVPLAYISVMITALAIFSRVYRRRRAAEKTSFEPWFPKHPSRETYITLISASSSSSSSETPIPDSLLKSALLVRAITDVKRIWRLRDDKIALTQLSQKGLIGDDTMLRFSAAEKELEAEIVDVVSEANSFRQGWGQMIFATATEMAQAEKTRETVMNIPKIKAQEDKRIALRNKYLPGSVPPPLIQQVPIPPQAVTASGSGSGTSTPSPSANSSSGKVATPQKVPAASGSPALASSETVAPGSGETSKDGSPNPNTGSGSGSGTSTPSKSTPGKKKKGKK